MKYFVILLAFVALLSCSTKPPLAEPDELIEADIAFSKMSAEEGMKEAFLHYADEEVVLLRKNSLPIEGKSSLNNFLQDLDDSNFVLIWEPLNGMISSSGDLGFTYGIYQMFQNQEDTISEKGTYVSIWKKNPEGEWRYVLDTGQEGLGEE